MNGFIELTSMMKDKMLVRINDITLVTQVEGVKYALIRLHGSTTMIKVKHTYDEIKRLIEENGVEEDDLK